MPRKPSKADLAWELEKERDTSYFIRFYRKGRSVTEPPEKQHFPDIRTGRNPDRYPELLDHAINEFQQQHNVSDWRQISDYYKVISQSYP